MGTSYAFTDDGLSYEFFACQSLDETHAGEAQMQENMNRFIKKMK